MRQVKIFKVLESEWQSLERGINRWIDESGATVLDVSGSIAPQSTRSHPNARENPSDILVIVTYEPAASPVSHDSESRIPVGVN